MADAAELGKDKPIHIPSRFDIPGLMADARKKSQRAAEMSDEDLYDRIVDAIKSGKIAPESGGLSPFQLQAAERKKKIESEQRYVGAMEDADKSIRTSLGKAGGALAAAATAPVGASLAAGGLGGAILSGAIGGLTSSVADKTVKMAVGSPELPTTKEGMAISLGIDTALGGTLGAAAKGIQTGITQLPRVVKFFAAQSKNGQNFLRDRLVEAADDLYDDIARSVGAAETTAPPTVKQLGPGQQAPGRGLPPAGRHPEGAFEMPGQITPPRRTSTRQGPRSQWASEASEPPGTEALTPHEPLRGDYMGVPPEGPPVPKPGMTERAQRAARNNRGPQPSPVYITIEGPLNKAYRAYEKFPPSVIRGANERNSSFMTIIRDFEGKLNIANQGVSADQLPINGVIEAVADIEQKALTNVDLDPRESKLLAEFAADVQKDVRAHLKKHSPSSLPLYEKVVAINRARVDGEVMHTIAESGLRRGLRLAAGGVGGVLGFKHGGMWGATGGAIMSSLAAEGAYAAVPEYAAMALRKMYAKNPAILERAIGMVRKGNRAEAEKLMARTMRAYGITQEFRNYLIMGNVPETGEYQPQAPMPGRMK